MPEAGHAQRVHPPPPISNGSHLRMKRDVSLMGVTFSKDIML